MNLKGNKAFSLRKVLLRNEYLLNAYQKDCLYLTAFDVDKLLAGFRETAGLDMRGVERYGGWESMLIGGHSLGHYITACVKSCESANCAQEDREQLLQILKQLMEGLQECQEHLGTGFLFGATIQDKSNIEAQFDFVEDNKTNIITQAWVPWYTMHKIFEGLVSTANMELEGTESIKKTAKSVASKLADWVYKRVSGWSEETHRTVLGIEYGGMNDCLYDVYLLTGKKEHLEAAHAFDQVELFEKVLQAKAGDNILNNHHANTTIPKFMGALKRYVVTGEDKYLEYAAHFWNLVTENHTYVTGGNSEWEHFGADKVLDKERTNCNCETCNAYNMLKMTKLLFNITGNGKYADWYENTFINSVLSSQNPQTGMTTYFQPMASGYYKVFGERFNKFWCCTGTGMENFSKLQESFYFEKDNTLIVNQYQASEVVFGGVKVTLDADIPKSDKVILHVEDKLDGNILLRLPYWLAAPAKIIVNGEDYTYSIIGKEECKGYALVEGPFCADTKIEVSLPMQIYAYNLPDGNDTYAFKYGPVVLSALLGEKDKIDATTGVIVTIPSNQLIEKEYVPSGKDNITVLEGSVAEFIENINDHLVRQGEEVRFELKGTDAKLTYVPHFSQYTQRYGIYFKFVDKDAVVSADNISVESHKIDTVQPGYGQYENDALHNMQEVGTGSVGTTQGGTSRYAKQNGGFTYTMEVDTQGTALLVTFKTADTGKSIRIMAGEEVIFEKALEGDCEEEYYDEVISITDAALEKSYKKFYDCRERKVLDITFCGIDGEESAAVCQFIYTLKK